TALESTGGLPASRRPRTLAASEPAVRILLLEVPKLLRDILERAIRARDGFEVIRDTRPVLQALTESGTVPDVVVLGLSAEDDAPLVPIVLSRWPMARVIAIYEGGKSVEI